MNLQDGIVHFHIQFLNREVDNQLDADINFGYLQALNPIEIQGNLRDHNTASLHCLRIDTVSCRHNSCKLVSSLILE